MKRSRPRVARTLKGKSVSPAPPGTVSGGIKIPSILFEGDKPEAAPAASLAPTASLRSSDSPARVAAGPRELPEAYGTGRLLVLARDPHCLYAHWDLTSAQLKQYESMSADGRLMVRCLRDEAAGPVAGEIPTQAGARHVFLNVVAAGASYVVELGYYGAERQWVPIAISSPAATPHDTVSEDRRVTMATTPPWPQLPASLPTSHRPITPPRVGWIPVLGLGSAIPTRARAPRPGAHQQFISEEWSETQERKLAELMGLNLAGQGAMSSLELTLGWDYAE